MTDLVLIVVTSLMFLFGWFLMKQLDFILDENQKRIKKASEQQQPEPCVHLGEDISPDNTTKPNQALAHAWKCPYHNGRMCIEMIHRLSAVS